MFCLFLPWSPAEPEWWTVAADAKVKVNEKRAAIALAGCILF